ncbi:hypothetical protein VULLAG_LOCUS14660 [Vulpes lagopus]
MQQSTQSRGWRVPEIVEFITRGLQNQPTEDPNKIHGGIHGYQGARVPLGSEAVGMEEGDVPFPSSQVASNIRDRRHWLGSTREKRAKGSTARQDGVKSPSLATGLELRTGLRRGLGPKKAHPSFHVRTPSSGASSFCTAETLRQ